MSNQFFADLELVMRPQRDATSRVVNTAQIFAEVYQHGKESTLSFVAFANLQAALAELEEVTNPTRFCTVQKPVPMGSTNYWQRSFPKLEHPELCGRPAPYNNHTRCVEHKERGI